MYESHRFSDVQTVAAFAVFVAATLAGPAAHAQTLYDGSLGTTPGNQPWLSLGSIPTTSDTYNAGGFTTLNTSASNSTYAGYSNYSLTTQQEVNSKFPTLDATQGFSLNFTLQVAGENTVPMASGTPPSLTNNPRAGTSVILLDSQHQGIELGFDTNSIFSQSSDFTTSSEFVSSALPSAMTSYTLTILGTGYTLSSGGLGLLTGAIKQYSGTGFPASVVYNEPNFLFIGDDTTANGGSFNFKSASLNAGGSASAPEPGALALLASGITAIAGAGFRRRRL